MVGYIIGIIIGTVVLVAFMLFLLYRFLRKRSSERLVREIGRTSEEIINKDISSWAKITKNRFIGASLFKYGEDSFFEVDSILLTRKAIIVIEIKSIKGKIVGNANDETWSKVLGDQKFPLVNPIKQNDRHIAHIEKMTSIKAPTVSLVVYSNRATSLEINSVPAYALVIRHAELFETLDSISQSLPEKISDEELKVIEKALRANITTSRADLRKFSAIVKEGQ